MDAPRLVAEKKLAQFYGKGVLERTYELPDGKPDKFYVFSGQTPAIFLPLTADNEVIAVRQFRYGANDFVLELPGGVIRQGSTPEETTKRELLEETGYKSERIVSLSGQPIWFDPASFTVGFLAFVCINCQKEQEPNLEKTEIMETVLIPLKEWVNMIRSGEVRDSKSIATTFLALLYLQAR